MAYGNGPPPLPARADVTAPRSALTAEIVAVMTDRSFLFFRWGMPGSFQPSADSTQQGMLRS